MEQQENTYLGNRLEELDDKDMQFVADCLIQQHRHYEVNPIDDSIEIDDNERYNDIIKVYGEHGYGGIDVVDDIVYLGNNTKAINHFAKIVVSKLGKEWNYYYNGENLTIWNTQNLILSDDKEYLIQLENNSQWFL